jgi:hypothetical protein
MSSPYSHRVQGWLILESGSVSYGKATAYLPVIDLLKGYFKIQDRDDHREIRDKVIGRVLGSIVRSNRCSRHSSPSWTEPAQTQTIRRPLALSLNSVNVAVRLELNARARLEGGPAC